MGESLYDEALSEPKLDEAKERLSAFETKAFAENRMARLRRESPRHPLLLGMTASIATGALFTMSGAILAAIPLVDTNMMRTFAGTPGLKMLPAALVLLGICGFVAWAGFRGLASVRAVNSPLLPHHAAELNRLRSDVQRMRAQIDVKERLTGTPAPSRVQASYY